MKINLNMEMDISSEELRTIVELDNKSYRCNYISNYRPNSFSPRRERVVNRGTNDNTNDRRSNYCHHDQSEFNHQPSDKLYKFKVGWPSYKKAIDEAIAEDDRQKLRSIIADLAGDSASLRDYLNLNK